jgi:hypothetical protein
MSFHTWHNEGDLKSQITFTGMDIKYKYETKFLSLHLTEDIKWNNHVKHLSSHLKEVIIQCKSFKIKQV